MKFPIVGTLLAAWLAGAAQAAAPGDLAALREQAEAGDTRAQCHLGCLYRDGDDVARDYGEAVSWFRRAVAADDASALDHLGWMYLNGFGVGRDLAEARRLFAASADRGHAQAMYNLGELCMYGLGGEQDPREAIRLWTAAAQKGHAGAVGRIATSYLYLPRPSGTPEELEDLLRRLGDAGNAEALRARGRLLWLGSGVPKDVGQAAELWRQADIRDAPKEPLLSMEEWSRLASMTNKPGHFRLLPASPLSQGFNLCAPTAAAIALSCFGVKADPLEIKSRCPNSPPGDGTAWDQLLASLERSGARWRLKEYDVTDAGFDEGLRAVKAELDAGRPVVIDIRKERDAGTNAGAHSVVAVGYEEEGGALLIQNPASLLPGLERYPCNALKRRWQSRWYIPSATRETRPALFTSHPEKLF